MMKIMKWFHHVLIIPILKMDKNIKKLKSRVGGLGTLMIE